ncbi:peptidylprolyl isomerase [Phenylobacterium soli]|uniref:Parvulin-like PPIase n=1 Tax=Phenylobacterium soli TaxID=2170551 RepID=A0A328AKM5_9CAUL|nr:peptidylprolyl isomerase [Phenylobacterium soli]RAK55149.1 peptidylprolyl isomerase [Phenylobacterium soli]
MRSVVFDGVEIPEALVAQEAQNHPEATAGDAWKAAGHALALRALLLSRARQLGLAAETERDEEGREETDEEALIRALLDQELEVASPTTAECRRVYDAERARFRAPALYEASHVLIGAANDEDEAGQALAAGLIARLSLEPARFAELAAGHSACPSGQVGGSLGQLRPGDLVPEVEAVLDALAPGEIAGAPVRSRFGWHVLRLDRRIEARELPFELVEERIRLHLESRAWTAAAARYAAELTAEARAQGVALTLTPEGQLAPGSVTLGDFLRDGHAAARLQPWLAATDPSLAERLARAAEAAGETVGDFVDTAVADFLETADDERWTNLISAARDAEDPALACLAAVLRSKIEPAKRTFTIIRRAGA